LPEKPKISMYWSASCGGCEISLVNLHERFLDVAEAFDLVFCPCLMDTKRKDVEQFEDESIDITFFNGSIRNSDNMEMAALLRRKSKILVAFGSCAIEGCIPGLSNLHPSLGFLESIYNAGPTIDNKEGTIPRVESYVPEGKLTLPEFYSRVSPLADVTLVDYFIPGCPPEPHQIWAVLDSVIQGKELPPRGNVVGGGRTIVCDECKLKRENKKVKRLYRTYEIIPEPDLCLMEQGIVCMGLATRDGCGGLCPDVNMPCIGCYGPPEGSEDQGMSMVAALGSMLDPGELKGIDVEELNRRVDEILDSMPDYAGTFYKFSLAGSILRGKV
jgi:F420-non-reducing hydrogenase small subunit